MTKLNEIRAEYDAKSIVVYQAYATAIAIPALKAQRFVEPFSFGRMTWIKPSFLWLMERSNWGQKSGQQHILAVKMTRTGWDEALGQGILTNYEPKVHRDPQAWHQEFEQAHVHVQWDPDRSIRGADLGYNAIQVGISRHLIKRFVEEWILEIKDFTQTVRRTHELLRTGRVDQARRLLPPERVYAVDTPTTRRLGMGH